MNDEVKRRIDDCITKRYAKLDLSNCNLSSIPKEVEKLKWLQTLNMNNNYIRVIQNLPYSLKKLYISENHITKIENLPSSLTRLNITLNRISVIEKLSNNLRELYISENQIEKIENLPSGINRLYINSNRIKKLENLPSRLSQLFINDNQIEKIENLPKRLHSLNIGRNYIEKIENLPESIKILIISKNKIKNLQESIQHVLNRNLKLVYTDDWLAKNGEVNLKDNPLEPTLIDIIHEGHFAVVQYMEQYIEEKGKEEFLFESKLLILGESEAGKTTFSERLRKPDAPLPHKDATTHGIEVGKWTFPVKSRTVQNLNHKDTEFYANLWDFGGQDVYHGTHKFFFSEKSLYVLLVDTREQKTDFSYWLNTIEQLTGEKSSLLILLNRRAKRDYRLDENGLRGRFGSLIKQIYTIDLSIVEDIPDLQNLIKNLLTSLPEIGVKLIESWVLIREDLAKETGKSISYERFREICRNRNVKNPEFIKNISRYFTRIGVFNHYIDSPILEDKIYLDSNWLTDLVYEILDNEKVKENNGYLSQKEIEKITKDKKLDFEINKLVALLNKFGLMYKTPSGSYIVPRHLTDKPYINWAHEDSNPILHFKYTFDKYMPKGLMSQLIVALHKYIPDHDLVWNRGFNLSYKGANSEIMEQYGGVNQFDIRIIGEFRRDLLVIITEAFDEILSPFKKLEFAKSIKCPCNDCSISKTPYFHKISVLENAIIKKYKKPNPSVECQLSFEDVPVKELVAFIDVDKVIQQIQSNVQDGGDHSEVMAFLEKFSKEMHLRFDGTNKLIDNLSNQLRDELRVVNNHLENLNINDARIESLLEQVEIEILDAIKTLPANHQLQTYYRKAKEESSKSYLQGKNKLEYVLPIIPGILNYKGEVNANFKLKEIWEDMKNGDFFTKEV